MKGKTSLRDIKHRLYSILKLLFGTKPDIESAFVRGKSRLLLLSLYFIFCFILTGCAKNVTKTTIEFSSWGSQSEIEILKPILSEFEHENPDIKVDFIHIPQNYFPKIHLLFASNLAPDVIFINNLYLPIYANAGVLEEVNSKQQMANSEENSIYHLPFTFYPKALEALSYKGKLYAIPRDISTLVVYYNKDLFDKYDVKVPNKYWTFEDYLAISKKLTKDIDGDGKTDLWGSGFEENLFYVLPWLMSEGGGILSDNLNTIIFNEPESRKGLTFYADLRKKYHVAPTEAESASETMAQMFLQEKIAMQISGRWLVPKFREDAKFNWNVINFPAGNAGSIVPLDASGWAVAKSSKHKKEAMRLVKYLSSKESIEKFTQSGLIVPARIDVGGKCGKNEKVFINVIETSKPTPVSVNYNEILDDLQEKADYLFN